MILIQLHMNLIENMNFKYKHQLYVFCMVMLVGCSSDTLEQLGNGYNLARTNKYNHSIIKGYAVVVDTNITKYLFDERYIVGCRAKPVWFDVDEKTVSDKYGYFIFDKKSGTLDEGMNEKEFILRVTLLDISQDKTILNSFIETN